MFKRIKIISGIDAGSVVNQVNKLLLDEWQILSEYVIATHSIASNVLLVPCYVFFLIKEAREI